MEGCATGLEAEEEEAEEVEAVVGKERVVSWYLGRVSGCVQRGGGLSYRSDGLAAHTHTHACARRESNVTEGEGVVLCA